ncbi:MAG: peroxide stress protein YaaA [Pseudomonadota bacterium]
MLVVISPAKRLDWTPVPRGDLTRPDFEADAMRLARTARNLTLKGLEELMDISPDLARLNRDRFKAFSDAPEAEALRPAAFAFAGDTYQGLEAATLGEDDLRWAQDHLRILSGLYGVLRPLDEIQAYRLEMGSRLKTRRGGSLYAYWGKEIAKSLRAQAEVVGAGMIVNCASQEYFGAVDLKALKLPVVTPNFYEEKDGTAKMVSFFAKKARGAMARFVVQNRVTHVDGLKDFDLGGYRFDAERSDGTTLSFKRPYPDPAKAA